MTTTQQLFEDLTANPPASTVGAPAIIRWEDATGPLYAPSAPRRGPDRSPDGQPPEFVGDDGSTAANGRRQRVQTSVSSGGFVSQETNVEPADGRALLLFVDNEFIAPGARTTATTSYRARRR